MVRLWLGPSQLLISVKDPKLIKEVLEKAEDKLPLTGRVFRLAFGHSTLFASSFKKVIVFFFSCRLLYILVYFHKIHCIFWQGHFFWKVGFYELFFSFLSFFLSFFFFLQFELEKTDVMLVFVATNKIQVMKITETGLYDNFLQWTSIYTCYYNSVLPSINQHSPAGAATCCN